MDSNRNLDPGNIPSPPEAHARVCDYEGSSYRADFWTSERTYEDAVERIALRALLPPRGQRFIEIGAGFGRLVDLYREYHQVILFDYSRSMLKEARARWGEVAPCGRPRYTYVAGDFNALPFAADTFDTVIMVRVVHHAPDVARVLEGIQEIIKPSGSFVLEYANKRNLKSIARWFLGQQDWSPFELLPYEFAEMNFDFHPHWMQTQLNEAGFEIQAQRSVSHLRLSLFKRLVPTAWLIKLDSLVQPTGRWWQLTPSVFVKSQSTKAKPEREGGELFRCPVCRSTKIVEHVDRLVCQACQREWPIHDGIYDFKGST